MDQRYYGNLTYRRLLILSISIKNKSDSIRSAGTNRPLYEAYLSVQGRSHPIKIRPTDVLPMIPLEHKSDSNEHLGDVEYTIRNVVSMSSAPLHRCTTVPLVPIDNRILIQLLLSLSFSIRLECRLDAASITLQNVISMMTSYFQAIFILPNVSDILRGPQGPHVECPTFPHSHIPTFPHSHIQHLHVEHSRVKYSPSSVHTLNFSRIFFRSIIFPTTSNVASDRHCEG
jgi:hypothetical protein